MARFFSCVVLPLLIFQCVCGISWGDEEKLPDDVPSLIKLLHDKEARVRANAASRLGNKREQAAEAVPDLISLLTDGGWGPGAINVFVYNYASVALARIGRSAVRPLIDALSNPNAEIREKAAMTLGYMKPTPKEALPRLALLLGDSHEWVRFRAVEAIGHRGKDAIFALPTIITMSKNDPEWVVRMKSLESAALIDENGKIVVPACILALKDKDPHVRSQAATTLAIYGLRAKPAIAALTAALEDQAMRYQAVSNDVCIRHAVRCDVAEALGKIGPVAAPALPKLHEMFRKDDDAESRYMASQAILQIDPRDEKVLVALIALIKDDEEAEYALQVLINIGVTAKKAAPTIISVLHHKKWAVRCGAVEALAAVDGREAIPHLIEQIEWEKSVYAKKDAAKKAREEHPNDESQELEEDDNYDFDCSDIFVAIAEALGGFGADAAHSVPAIASTLSHPATWLDMDKEHIVEALGAIGPAAKDAVPELIKLLDKDEDYATDLRMKTAVVLGRIGPAAKAAVPRLLKLADEDIERDVRDAARKAVHQIAGDSP